MKAKALSSIQTFTIVISTMIGAGIMSYQAELISTANQDAWVSTLLAGILVAGFGFLAYALAKFFPTKDLPEIGIEVFGKIMGRIFIILTTAYTLTVAALVSRIFAEFVRLFLLSNTPYSVLLAGMLISVIVTAKRGIYVLGVVMDFCFPVFMSALITLILLAFFKADTINIHPILFNNTKNVLKAVVKAFPSYAGFGTIIYILKYMKQPKDAFKWFALALGSATVIYTALMIATIMALDTNTVKGMVFPTVELANEIEVGRAANIRLDVVFITVWVISVFTTALSYSFVTARNLTVFFGLKSSMQKYLTYSLLPIEYVIAGIPQNTLDVSKWLGMLGYAGMFLAVVAIPMTLCTALIKKRLKQANKKGVN